MRYPSMVALLVIVLGASWASAAEKKARVLDLIWTSPDFASIAPPSIALLPVATYDDNLETRRIVEGAVGQALRGSGHRWLSATSARDLLQRAGGDSLLLAVKESLQRDGRVDSIQAPSVARAIRTRALLAVRVEGWERVVLEPTQAGRPYTQVRLSAALVDSTGRLLWSARGSEVLEGQYRDPSSGVVGMKASGLSDQPLTNTAGAPTYVEVLNKLLARWSPQFPRRVVAAAAADSAR